MARSSMSWSVPPTPAPSGAARTRPCPTIGSTTLTFAQLGSAGGTVDIEDEGSARGRGATPSTSPGQACRCPSRAARRRSTSQAAGSSRHVPGATGSRPRRSRRRLRNRTNGQQHLSADRWTFGHRRRFYHDWRHLRRQRATRSSTVLIGQSQPPARTSTSITMQLTLVRGHRPGSRRSVPRQRHGSHRPAHARTRAVRLFGVGLDGMARVSDLDRRLAASTADVEARHDRARSSTVDLVASCSSTSPSSGRRVGVDRRYNRAVRYRA